MKRLTVIFIILLSISLFSQSIQYKPVDILIFQNPNTLAISTDDTISSITSSDSVYIQMGEGGNWKLLTQVVTDTAMVTASDKSAEGRVIFNLAGEDFWANVGTIKFRILSTNIDTCESFPINIKSMAGALTLHIVADTSGTSTIYDKSRLIGN